jgi:zinc protease
MPPKIPQAVALAIIASSIMAVAPHATLASSRSPASVAPSQPWAQSQSDVPADPAVRFGTLSNGLRYAIMHNATPPGQASLEIRIDAGSLMEKDDQLGLAHFLEHMLFNGTRDIPKNDLIHILERMGMAFGADLNAATTFDETFYQLHLPHTDDQMLSTGLYVLREQVSEATIKQQDVLEERGVIKSEERLRNSPAYRASKAEMPTLAKGQRIADRFPIGDMKIIDAGPRQRIADFYDTYYRPSRATIVAVGDFDVDAMEARIREKFADWTPKAADGPEPDLGRVAAHGPETHAFVEPGVSSSVDLTWVKAPDLRPDTVAKRREKLLQSLGTAVLNRRLSELSRTDDPPFLVASAGAVDLLRSLGQVSLDAQYASGGWRRALDAIDQEQRRFVQYGISDAELQREITTARTGLEQGVAGASTRQSGRLADGLVNSVNGREVFISPETHLALFEEAIKGVTAAQVNALIKPMFEGGGPLTMMVTPTPIEGGEAAVTAALDASHQVAVAPLEPPAKLAWPYTDFGSAGKVVNRREIKSLGATVVTFSNGVVLTVKSTDFDKDSIQIRILTGIGERSFSPDRIDPVVMYALGNLNPGGLGKLNSDEMSRSLNGHVIGAGLGVLGDKFLFSGGTRRADFQLEMQVLAAYLTDPAFRSAPFEQTKRLLRSVLESQRATPRGAFSLGSPEILAGGDKRTAVPKPEEVDSWSMDSTRSRVRALLAKGPIHITMVGDLTVDEAIAATATTFGALLPRAPDDPPAPGADQRHFPAPTATPVHFTHNGLAEQAMGYVAWPTTDGIGTLAAAETRKIQLLAAVLKLRALDEIRERLAIAYSPGVAETFSDVYRGYGYLSIEAQTTPQNLSVFFKAVDDITRDLRDKPISEDELKRAREPMIQDARAQLQTNAWWMVCLAYIVDRPWTADVCLTMIPELEAMTPADIQALARKYLGPYTAWKADVKQKVTVADAGRGQSGDPRAPAMKQ